MYLANLVVVRIRKSSTKVPPWGGAPIFVRLRPQTPQLSGATLLYSGWMFSCECRDFPSTAYNLLPTCPAVLAKSTQPQFQTFLHIFKKLGLYDLIIECFPPTRFTRMSFWRCTPIFNPSQGCCRFLKVFSRSQQI